MKKGEHTPGPWRATPHTVTAGKVNEWSIDADGWKTLALVNVMDDESPSDPFGFGDANAHLITAAPIMYQLLVKIHDMCGVVSPLSRIKERSRIAYEIRDAIANARGQK